VEYFLIICSKPSNRGLKSNCWGESEGAWLWSNWTNFTDFLGFAMSVVSANWRALRTVVAKSTSLACSLRYCDISNDSRPSSKRRLRVMSLKSAEAEGRLHEKVSVFALQNLRWTLCQPVFYSQIVAWPLVVRRADQNEI